jgi:Dihydrodipicolinate synthetase family
MPRATQYVPHGVIPAVLLPFAEDLSIDENSFRKHLRDVAETSDLSAITINAHSTEVASCTLDEQRRVLDIARGEVGDRLPIVNGVWADGSLEAARIARMAEKAVPRRFWCSRRRRSRSDSRRRWQSSTSSVSPTRVPCRLSPSSTRWRPVRAIRAKRC